MNQTDLFAIFILEVILSKQTGCVAPGCKFSV
jgi:hypothetical protein